MSRSADSSLKGMKVDSHILTSNQYQQDYPTTSDSYHPMNSHRYSHSSGSTPSLPLSIPYYYIANNSDSFDTVHMLNSFSNNQPLYSNTSHLNLLSGSATPNLNPIPIPIPIPEDKQHLPKTKDPLAPPVPSKNFVVDFGANNPVEQPLHHPQQQYHQGADSNSGPFNQVPKRFSQFILDQQNPYMVQRLDHLSMNLISLYSGGTPSYIDQGRSSRRNTANANLTGGSTTPSNKKTSTTTSDSHRNSGGVSNTINNNEINNNNSNNIRDILDSMGSQATIFSTRLNDNSSSHSLSSSNMASGGLRRSKAVKSKNGILYRLKLRLTKLGKRMKRVFKVKRRKTVKPIGPASQKRRNNILRHFKLKKGDDGTLSRNRSKRSNKQAKSKAKSTSLHISAPVQNQDLSLGSDDRALELVPMDSRLKFRAGLQFVNETELPDLPNEDDSIKRKTLSPPAIIPALNPLTTTGKFSTRKPPPPPEAPQTQQPPLLRRDVDQTQPLQPTGLQSPLHDDPSLERSASGKHRKSFHAPIVDDLVEEALINAWKQYLSHVIASRIKLRQEINFYQSLKKELNYSFGIHTDDETASLSSSAYTNTNSSIHPNSSTNPNTSTSSRYSSMASSRQFNTKPSLPTSPGIRHSLLVKTVATQTTIYESDDESAISILDQTTEQFNKSFANRHSVLGEMLDYESDNTSIASTNSSISKRSNNTVTVPRSGTGSISGDSGVIISDDDLGLGKRYGTVIRRSSPSKNSTTRLGDLSDKLTLSPKRNNSSQESLRRSPGLRMGLSSVASGI